MAAHSAGPVGRGVFARFTDGGCCHAVSHLRLNAHAMPLPHWPRKVPQAPIWLPVRASLCGYIHQTGSNHTRLALVREGLQRQRAPESDVPSPSPFPQPTSRAVPVAPKWEICVPHFPSSSKRTEKPEGLSGCSLGACVTVPGDPAHCLASHPCSSRPQRTPSHSASGAPRPRPPGTGLALSVAPLLGVCSPSLPSSPSWGFHVFRPLYSVSFGFLLPRSSLGVLLILVSLSIAFDQMSPPALNGSEPSVVAERKAGWRDLKSATILIVF